MNVALHIPGAILKPSLSRTFEHMPLRGVEFSWKKGLLIV
jgi:hypothetical protein